ncbi:MAG: sugar-binding domain-containing protein [Melioribacteraceae bacterium]
MNEKYLLNKNWELSLGKNYSPFTPEAIKKIKSIQAEVPGTVHTDLLKNNLIDDPFYSDNENKLGWVSESDWIYKTTFDLPFLHDDSSNIKLVFEGIDTIAKIFLNNIQIGTASNMFIKYEFDVTKILNEKNNELKLIFESPIKYAEKQERYYGKLPVALNSYRVYIRKAQYSFGWDWGPSFPTMGVWKNVYLKKINKAEIENFRFYTKEIKNNYAIVEIELDIKRFTDEKISAIVKIFNENVSVNKLIEIENYSNKIKFKIENPELWMPNGYGKPNLYNLEIKIIDDKKNVIDSLNKKVGIRKIELQLKEKNKNTFKFIINGKKIFAKGVNWIPADAFLTRVTEDKYHQLLLYARDAKMNFVRVWGGGIYENDLFYEICDELGLLVWQDFMFACGSYPEHKEFIQNIKEEINYNVNRLQYHPSIAIWCGNNENEWIWYQEQKKSYKKMPGYKIFSKVIPSILENLDSYRPYWQSSPFGFDEDPNSPNSGNRHQWDIWSRWIDYSFVKYDNSLFVTEFGFQGPANKSTLEKFIPVEERKINSRIFEFHNKQIEGPERVIKFLYTHLPLSTKWDEFIYLTQLNQALALKTCLLHWRFNQPRTNGSIIWQINDTWPVVSWSLIDSDLKPKLSYYFVKKSFNEIAIKVNSENNQINILGLNQSEKNFKGILKLIVADSLSGRILSEEKKSITIKGESINNLYVLKNYLTPDSVIIIILHNDEEKEVFRDVFIVSEWKHLRLPQTNIKLKLINQGEENYLEVSADKLSIFVDFISPDIIFEDRGIILLPNETRLIRIFYEGNAELNENNIEIFCLNKFLCNKYD